jgi:hypothetical protein
MPYHLAWLEDPANYLASLADVPDQAKARLIDHFERELALATDHFRDQHRPDPGKACFYYEPLIVFEGVTYHFRAYVDDSHASMGILRIAYLELLHTIR